MITLEHLDYLTPKTLEEAVRLLGTTDGISILAGGTDLVPLMKYGVKKPKALLSLAGIPGLNDIEFTDVGAVIGVMVTLDDLARDERIREKFPIVADGARAVASPQIRNVGTVGGNLFQETRCLYYNQTGNWRKSIGDCFKVGGNVCRQAPGSKECRALYYSDLAPALIAMGAEVDIQTENGRSERVPLMTAIERRTAGTFPTGIAKSVFIPSAGSSSRGVFLKYAMRGSVDFAVANVALHYLPSETNNGTVRLVMGAVAPTPVRLNETEALLAEVLSGGTASRDRLMETALKEAAAKSRFIRETAVPMRLKKNTLHAAAEAIEKLLAESNIS